MRELEGIVTALNTFDTLINLLFFSAGFWCKVMQQIWFWCDSLRYLHFSHREPITERTEWPIKWCYMPGNW